MRREEEERKEIRSIQDKFEELKHSTVGRPAVRQYNKFMGQVGMAKHPFQQPPKDPVYQQLQVQKLIKDMKRKRREQANPKQPSPPVHKTFIEKKIDQITIDDLTETIKMENEMKRA